MESPIRLKVSISVYGDTAIVRGESYTLTFINQLGVWRAVSLHTSSADKIIRRMILFRPRYRVIRG